MDYMDFKCYHYHPKDLYFIITDFRSFNFLVTELEFKLLIIMCFTIKEFKFSYFK